ncbi:MAG: hypothetical protein KAS32_25975 [Candidatus Peribacteraceae bacterium]|nr:hypothetical protein [Candidatus Peribacteraceae bacterium]
MSVTDKLTKLYNELEQKKDAVKVRTLLQHMRETVSDGNSKIQAIVDAGQFDTLDSEIKTVLQSGWQAAEDFETALATPEIKELLDRIE